MRGFWMLAVVVVPIFIEVNAYDDCGYTKSYQYKHLCQKCPHLVHMEVDFDFEDLVENRFFCNGDDCNCTLGKKCCPVLYSVTYAIRGRTIVENMNGCSCLPAVIGECENPEESCSEPNRNLNRSSRASSRRSSRS